MNKKKKVIKETFGELQGLRESVLQQSMALLGKDQRLATSAETIFNLQEKIKTLEQTTNGFRNYNTELLRQNSILREELEQIKKTPNIFQRICKFLFLLGSGLFTELAESTVVPLSTVYVLALLGLILTINKYNTQIEHRLGILLLIFAGLNIFRLIKLSLSKI